MDLLNRRQHFPWPPLLIALAMILAAVAGLQLRPTHLVAEAHRLDLGTAVPMAFLGWHRVEEGSRGVVDASTQKKLDELYSRLLSSTYMNLSLIHI